jgi:hypothetical protein
VLAIADSRSAHAFVVRASINNPSEVFNKISRCSYPPDCLRDKIKIQRANYPGQQVFYCTVPLRDGFAGSQATCVLETAAEYIEDENLDRFYLTISRWDCKRPLNLWVLPFCKEACENNAEWEEI